MIPVWYKVTYLLLLRYGRYLLWVTNLDLYAIEAVGKCFVNNSSKLFERLPSLKRVVNRLRSNI